MREIVVVIVLFVSTINANADPFLRDLLISGQKRVNDVVDTVAGNVVNLTSAAFMDANQFTKEMARKIFQVFKERNNKTYATPDEESKRLSIFFDNFLSILTHNKLFQTRGTNYTLGVTPFTDLTDEEFAKDVCNCLRGTDSDKTKISYQAAQEPPPEIDWRKLGAVTSVKQQETCGSCWTFAAAGAMEGAHFIATKELKDISVQNLLDCAGGNCAGGHYARGFMYAIKNQGVNELSEYPYENAKNSCRFDSEKTKLGHVKKFFKLPVNDEEELKKAVAFHGPVAVGINSSGMKLFKSTGVYYDTKICGKYSKPAHAVLVVGYGTTPENEDYWIIKNSWGPEWGDEGYIKLARNKGSHCNVAYDGVYPIM